MKKSGSKCGECGSAKKSSGFVPFKKGGDKGYKAPAKKSVSSKRKASRAK